MPTPIKNVDNLTGDYTVQERKARQEADALARRKGPVKLRPPAWLKENELAMQVWKEIVRKLKGIELLDNLDTELLAAYCDSIVSFRNLTKRIDDPHAMNIDDLIKARQSELRIMISLAEKLGLTPGGRARLAKRKVEKLLDPFGDTFGV